MEISKRSEENVEIIDLKGEIDISVSNRIREAIRPLIDQRKERLLINLEGVTYIDSSGLGVLVESLQEMKKYGGRIKLVKLNPDIRKVFEVTRLDTFFEICQEEREALDSFQ